MADMSGSTGNGKPSQLWSQSKEWKKLDQKGISGDCLGSPGRPNRQVLKLLQIANVAEGRGATHKLADAKAPGGGGGLGRVASASLSANGM